MTDEEFARVANEAINAAQKVLHDAGITDKVVHQLGFAKIDDIKEGFHTFGVEWHEDEYIFYVNGQETWRTKEGVSNIAQYLILSIECCGWGGDVTKSNLPDEVIFDYVRVYKKKREKR